MNIITTKLPLAEKSLIGHPIPFHLFESANSGAIGLYVEQLLTNLGYSINTAAGPDLLSMNVEIKSRAKEAVSAHTIGSMQIDDIIRTPYKQSIIFDKFQIHFRVLYSRTFCEITHAQIYNFTAKHIQAIIEESYEAVRSILTEHQKVTIAEPISRYIRGKNSNGDLCMCYFENTGKSNSYDFRIHDADMKQLEHMVKSVKTSNNLFDFS